MGREQQEDRNAFLDIHAELDNGSKVNIEIQVTHEHHLKKLIPYVISLFVFYGIRFTPRSY